METNATIARIAMAWFAASENLELSAVKLRRKVRALHT